MRPTEALARAMYHEQLSQLNGERPWDQLSTLTDTRERWMHKARVVIDMLAGAGYVIQSERAALDEFQRMVAEGKKSVPDGLKP